MSKQAKPVPEGFHTLTPHLIVRNASAAIEFYKKAFGAEEVYRMPGPDGTTIMHAELQIGDSRLMICDEFPGEAQCQSPLSLKGTPVTLMLYVPDTDALYDRAV
jgi:uncharacterized glyoxalase superfamily protein PhnB